MSSLILGNKYIEVVNIYALTRFLCGDEDGACMLYGSVNNLEPVVLNTVFHVVGCVCVSPFPAVSGWKADDTPWETFIYNNYLTCSHKRSRKSRGPIQARDKVK